MSQKIGDNWYGSNTTLDLGMVRFAESYGLARLIQDPGPSDNYEPFRPCLYYETAIISSEWISREMDPESANKLCRLIQNILNKDSWTARDARRVRAGPISPDAKARNAWRVSVDCGLSTAERWMRCW